MAKTSVGAIYATGSLLLQRVYIPDFDDSEINQQFVGPGETLVQLPLVTYQTGGHPAMQTLIGTPTFSGVCAVVSSANVVIDRIIADPAIYTDPRGLTIASDLAMHGDTWTGTIFTRQFAEVSKATGLVVGISAQNIASPVPTTAGNYMISMGGSVTALQLGSVAITNPSKVTTPSTLPSVL